MRTKDLTDLVIETGDFDEALRQDRAWHRSVKDWKDERSSTHSYHWGRSSDSSGGWEGEPYADLKYLGKTKNGQHVYQDTDGDHHVSVNSRKIHNKYDGEEHVLHTIVPHDAKEHGSVSSAIANNRLSTLN